MNCPNCGAPVDDNQKFCGNCGAPIIHPTAQNNPFEGGSSSYAYDQSGSGRSGYTQGGSRSDYSQSSSNQSSSNQNNYNQSGYDQNGYSQNGYNQNGHGQSDYNQNGYGQNNYNQNGYSQSGYNQNGYNQNGSGPYSGSPAPYGSYNEPGYGLGIKKRNIVLAIIFSIITFGIYHLYWVYECNEDVNVLANEPDATSGGLVILFSIITLGIYSWYWSYKMGERVDRIKGIQGSDAVLYLILSIIGLDIVNLALIQDTVNRAVE